MPLPIFTLFSHYKHVSAWGGTLSSHWIQSSHTGHWRKKVNNKLRHKICCLKIVSLDLCWQMKPTKMCQKLQFLKQPLEAGSKEWFQKDFMKFAKISTGAETHMVTTWNKKCTTKGMVSLSHVLSTCRWQKYQAWGFKRLSKNKWV